MPATARPASARDTRHTHAVTVSHILWLIAVSPSCISSLSIESMTQQQNYRYCCFQRIALRFSGFTGIFFLVLPSRMTTQRFTLFRLPVITPVEPFRLAFGLGARARVRCVRACGKWKDKKWEEGNEKGEEKKGRVQNEKGKAKKAKSVKKDEMGKVRKR